ALAVVVFLLGEGFVARAESVVGNIGIDALVFQVLVVGVVGKAGIGSDQGAFFIDIVADAGPGKAILDASKNRLQRMVLLAFAKRLGLNDDLMLLVHRRHAVVALDGPFAGGHLGRFVVGDVALHFFRPLTLPHPW